MGGTDIEKKFTKLIKHYLKDVNQSQELDYIRLVLIGFIENYIYYTEEKNKGKLTELLKELKLEFKTEFELSRDIETAISGYVEKNRDNINGMTIGKLYQSIVNSAMKKRLGQVYTPGVIIDYIIDDAITAKKLVENPYLKILDPACGSGFFLIQAFRRLKSIFIENRERIVTKNPEFEIEYKRGIEEFIVRNSLHGMDIDIFSVYMTKFAIAIESKGAFGANIIALDILFGECDESFDIIIGNPPYIGFKNLESDYKTELRLKYAEVYQDKADISYCFFQRGYELLSQTGEIQLITSRYFLEALHAKKLRKYIRDNYGILRLVDFYGKNIFKGASISPVIIKLSKSKTQKPLEYYRFDKSKFNLNSMDLGEFKKLNIALDNLGSQNWILKSSAQIELFKKIDNSGTYKLSEIANSNQGIITGLDKAFILDQIPQISKEEQKLIKPWAKNSNIERYSGVNSYRYLIYTNDIVGLEASGVLEQHIAQFRDKLSARRECKTGFRQWYEIQWNRDSENFIGKRILFPYKSAQNRFAMVDFELYHSADIYSIKLKPEYSSVLSTEYLLGFLNSRLFEFYFKIIAKKLSQDIYEYYPNKLMNLKLKPMENECEKKYLEALVFRIISEEDVQEKLKLSEEIDSCFFKLYGLSKAEIDLLLGSI